jgi:hypothetical protein
VTARREATPPAFALTFAPASTETAMIDFTKIRDDLRALNAAVASGTPGEILHAIADVTDDAGDLADFFTSAGVLTTAQKADPVAAECKTLCDQIAAECVAAKAGVKPMTGAGGPSKFGDGTILKLLLDSLPALIAIFKDLFGG